MLFFKKLPGEICSRRIDPESSFSKTALANRPARYEVQPSQTQSSQVKPKKWGGDSLSPQQPLSKMPQPQRELPRSHSSFDIQFTQMPVFNRNNNNNRINMLFFKKLPSEIWSRRIDPESSSSKTAVANRPARKSYIVNRKSSNSAFHSPQSPQRCGRDKSDRIMAERGVETSHYD